MRRSQLPALLAAVLLLAAPTLSPAGVDLSVSVSFAPPALPVYVQPPLPARGYLWTPGYWAWDGVGYYWVPGTWVLPPVSGLLWTPGYWAWRDGFYVWNPGYWGPTVGFYGGVNYGFGYTGVGFQGGYWHGGAFFYNRAVANFGHVQVFDAYSAPVERHEMSRVSFNGGPGGLRARPSAAERLAMSGRHAGPTVLQRQHEQGAAGMPGLHASENGGRPQILTTRLPADFSHPGPGLRNHPMPPAGAYGHAPRQGGGHNGPPREQGRREAGPPRDR